jgi:hypothetical protein
MRSCVPHGINPYYTSELKVKYETTGWDIPDILVMCT